ncbi:MAG TPA: pentapeptide repeat-containing protein [Methylophilaceae bacterium]|nr:pentapeptide repeat-containing protein [Methylophilaceae bacterium]
MRAPIWMAAATLALWAGLTNAGEFGDHCTNSLAADVMVETDCSNNSLFDGKTYCFSSKKSKAAFDSADNKSEIVAKASANYAKASEHPRVKISQADALAAIKSEDCDLSDKDLGYLELDGMDLRHCRMVNTSFFGAYLRGANLSGANLQDAYLNLARLEKADLSGANLTNATIFQAIFDQTNFHGANLTNARMIGTLGNVDMRDANVDKGRFGLDIGNQPMGAMRFDAVGGKFAHTNFEGADINRANLQFADFRGANLRHTDLFRADLSKADLTGADITGANLKEAVLDGTVMTDVKGLAAIEGYDIKKGKCIDCNVTASAAKAAGKDAAACVMDKK